MRIAAYASASQATPQAYLDAATRFGETVALRGHTLVNGGGKVGGMGAMNIACRRQGGKIVCVIHERFILDGVEFGEADEMITATGDSLGERKRLLAANADAIVALPGGIGTLDEVFEAAALWQLEFEAAKPVALLNIDGFYDGLLAQLERCFKDKLLRKTPSSIVYAAASVPDLIKWCERQTVKPTTSTPRSPVRRRQHDVLFLATAACGLAIGTLCGFVGSRVLLKSRAT